MSPQLVSFFSHVISAFSELINQFALLCVPLIDSTGVCNKLKSSRINKTHENDQVTSEAAHCWTVDWLLPESDCTCVYNWVLDLVMFAHLWLDEDWEFCCLLVRTIEALLHLLWATKITVSKRSPRQTTAAPAQHTEVYKITRWQWRKWSKNTQEQLRLRIWYMI